MGGHLSVWRSPLDVIASNKSWAGGQPKSYVKNEKNNVWSQESYTPSFNEE